MSGSKTLRMDKTDWRKWGIGVTIAVLGAIGTYFSDQVPGLEEAGREELATIFVILCSVISFGRKLLIDNTQPEPEPDPVPESDPHADTDAWPR